MGRRKRKQGMTRAERWRRARARFNVRQLRRDVPILGVLLVVCVVALMVMVEAIEPMPLRDWRSRGYYREDGRWDWWAWLFQLVGKVEVLLMGRMGVPRWAIVGAAGAVVVGCMGVAAYVIGRELRGDREPPREGEAKGAPADAGR